MPRRRSLSEIKRLLKRRLAEMHCTDASRQVAELRRWAIAQRFATGYDSIDEIVGNKDVGGAAWERADIERAIRSQTTLKE